MDAMLANVPDDMKDEARVKIEAHMNEPASADDVSTETFEQIYIAHLNALHEENAVLFNSNLHEFLTKLAAVYPEHAEEIAMRIDFLKGILASEGGEILVQQFMKRSEPVQEILDEHDGEGDWPDKVSRMLQSHGDSCKTAFGIDLRELWQEMDDNAKVAVADYIKTAWVYSKLYEGADKMVDAMRVDFETARLAAEKVFDEATRNGVTVTRGDMQTQIELAVQKSMAARKAQ